MHGTSYGEGDEEVTFFHNGDFSGDVVITVPDSKVECLEPDTLTFSVSMDAVEYLVLQKMRREIVASMEDMDLNELRKYFGRVK